MISESHLQNNQQQQSNNNISNNNNNNNNNKVNQQPHIMIKLLHQYQTKLQSQQHLYKQTLLKLKQSITQQFNNQLNHSFNQFQSTFTQNKHLFITQIKTLQYYIQNFMDRHVHNPKQNNLYPLFNQIDNKIQQNMLYLKQKFTFQFHYPQNKNDILQKAKSIKNNILIKQLKSLRQFLVHNQNISKYCKKQLNKVTQLYQQYEKLFKLASRKVYTSEIEHVGDFQQCMLVLEMNPKIQKLTLGIRSSKSGIMSIQQYRQVFSKILQQSQNILSSLTLKIMDMQFEQLKCNQMKLFIKQLKQLKSVRIVNYYRQNKLGMFEDFNWLPLKKQTHIIGKVW